jgi:hypothetical protein
VPRTVGVDSQMCHFTTAYKILAYLRMDVKNA